MSKTYVIYDAALLINAYETQLFRTGLYRVCSEVLKLLIQEEQLKVMLYDSFGREFELRTYIAPKWERCSIYGIHNAKYQRYVYPWLKKIDIERQNEHQTQGIKRCYHRLLKNAYKKIAALYKSNVKVQEYKDIPYNVHYISTYYPIPTWVKEKNIQSTIVIHDLIPIHHPEWFPNEANQHMLENICKSIGQQDHVICVSESTRKDFLHYYKQFPKEQTHVAHLAAADCFKPTPLDKSFSKRLGIKENDYILSVCTIEPRKNLKSVVNAFQKLKEQGYEKKLVLTGAFGWKNSDITEAIDYINTRWPNSIIITGFLEDQELAMLYSSCLCFVYMSLYEGFGLPPLEAMQCGANVITSNNSSLPEVVGDAGICIEATNIKKLADEILDLSDTKNELSPFSSSKTIQQAHQFSWSKCATTIKQTL